MKNWWNMPKLTIITHFCNHPSFINCVVENTIKMDFDNYDHILFSYHGLPERHVDKSHPEPTLCVDGNCEDGLSDDNHFSTRLK